MQFGGGVGAGAGGVAAAVAVVLDLLDQLSSVEMRWKRWCLIVMVWYWNRRTCIGVLTMPLSTTSMFVVLSPRSPWCGRRSFMTSCRTRSEAANRKCAGTFASIFSLLLLSPLLSENVSWFGMCPSSEPLLHTESELQFPSHLLSPLYAFTCTQACVDVFLPALCSSLSYSWRNLPFRF